MCHFRTYVLDLKNPAHLAAEDIKKIENTEAIAVDGQPIHHMQSGPQ